MGENRQRLVEALAPHRSFLDVGGMYAVAGDVAFWAEDAGATEVLLFDGMDPSTEFVRKHEARQSIVKYRQGDLHDPEDVRLLGPWDVVWCAGVIYHSPDPYRQLLHLRSLTKETLLLGSHIIPEVPGIEGGCIFYPGRSEVSEAAFAAFHNEVDAYPGMTKPFIDAPAMAYANMWWGISLSALRAMLHYAGFEIVSEYRYSTTFIDIVAQPGPEPNFIPPLGFSRERGHSLLETFEDVERPTWCEVPVID